MVCGGGRGRGDALDAVRARGVAEGGETRLTLCAHAGMRGWFCMCSAR